MVRLREDNVEGAMRFCELAARHVIAWVGPRSRPFDLIRIYALSMTIMFFFLYFGNILIDPGAADFIKLAELMLGGPNFTGRLINGAQGREIGMALIWLLSGYERTHSVTGVIVIQALMGLAIAPLAYLALHPWFPRAAYYTAMAAALTLAPILLFKHLHHDQPYIFFTMLSLYAFNRFMLTRTAGSLYGMSASIFSAGLMRDAGAGLFWLLLPLCALRGGRKIYVPAVVAALLFIAANAAYSQYRSALMGSLAAERAGVGGPGIQAFYNIYINTSEFGVVLSPDMGPSVGRILSGLHRCALPSPSQSEQLALWRMSGSAEFNRENIFRYTADELVEKVATKSNREYFYLILASGCVADSFSVLDGILLKASIEIALAHPLYVMELFLRNVFYMLYDPGWLHGRFTTAPMFRGGLSFPFGDYATLPQGGTVLDTRLSDRALREISFIPLERQPRLIRDVYFFIYWAWYYSYSPVTIIVGCLAWFAWISMLIGLLQRAINSPRLARWSKLWLSESVIPAATGVSVLLLGNVAVTAMAVDPLYRYDFSILMLKITLAGVGCAVLIELCRHTALPLLRKATLLQGGAIPGGDIVRNMDIGRDGNSIMADSLVNAGGVIEIKGGTD
jgi:hypothetical protein